MLAPWGGWGGWQVIRDSGGAVSAEQLAPLLSPGNPQANDNRVDESFVLPILTALDGAPEVGFFILYTRAQMS